MELKRFTLEWTITERDSSKQIKEFLKEYHLSKAALTDIKFYGGSISVDGEKVDVRHKLQTGENLMIVFPKEIPSKDMLPKEIPLDIVYEDSYLLVINKQPYLPTIPSREHPTDSLANAILHYYHRIGLTSTIHMVNRLDRDTSGLLVVAKYRHIHHLLVIQQKEGIMKRQYQAITHGLIKQSGGTINAPIGRKQDSIIERTVRDDGQYAVTHYSLLEKLENLTHVSVQLETGRTHQIRVHFSSIGHPLVGDDLYGGSKDLLNRQALHCSNLEFTHPIDQRKLKFSASLPDDMKELLLKYRNL